MNNSLNLRKHLVLFGIPLLLIGLLILLANSSMFIMEPNASAIGITIDLLLTIPLLYFLLIRKTKIPKTTVVPFLVLGVLVCSAVLPLENQHYLTLFKTWILPVVEISILVYAVYSVRKGIASYKLNKQGSLDFFTNLKNGCYEILPRRIAIFFAFEVATFYYGFLYWKKRELRENEFSYHRDSATLSTLFAFIMIIGIETFVFHLLLMMWSPLAAWIFTVLSIYTAIQLFGFLRSMIKRPMAIENNTLHLYYGLMNETHIDLEKISSVELTSSDLEYTKELRKFSFLDSPNVILHLKTQHTMEGLYGFKKNYRSLAIYVDNSIAFKKQLDSAIERL